MPRITAIRGIRRFVLLDSWHVVSVVANRASPSRARRWSRDESVMAPGARMAVAGSGTPYSQDKGMGGDVHKGREGRMPGGLFERRNSVARGFAADASDEPAVERSVAFDSGAHPSAPIPVDGPGLGDRVRVPLGETGLEVFPLILGGGEFGWHVDLAASLVILDRFADLGGNAVHTADAFAAGRSEHILGQWMRTRRNRDDIVVAVRVGAHPDNPGLGSTNLVRAVEASLTRLGTDRIDVLYLDGPADPHAPLEDVLATTDWLVETGKVRHVGAARFAPARLVEARVLSAAGYPRIEVVDVHYNVLERSKFEGDLRLVAGAQGLAVTPTHPLEHGFLSGRYRRRTRGPLSARATQIEARLDRRGQRLLQAIDRIADEASVPPAAVAIGWLLAQRLVAAPIANVYEAAHVDELVRGVGLTLSRTQLAELTRAVQ